MRRAGREFESHSTKRLLEGVDNREGIGRTAARPMQHRRPRILSRSRGRWTAAVQLAHCLPPTFFGCIPLHLFATMVLANA